MVFRGGKYSYFGRTKKRISFAKITEFLALIENLDIQVDNETSARSFREILSLAHSEKLTTYDAAYLELAMRLGLPLATKDKQLSDAALRLGVRLTEERSVSAMPS